MNDLAGLEPIPVAAYRPNVIRHIKPRTPPELWTWLQYCLGVTIPHRAVCKGHSSPFRLFARQFLRRPRISLVHGPRGSGKSMGAALNTHLTARFHPRARAAILGGSQAQSGQVYDAINEVVIKGNGVISNDGDQIRSFLKTEAIYYNGSVIEMLAASPKSIRGPHPQTLVIDEIDEVDPDIREGAMGMAMEKSGLPASVLMTSTWHHVGGSMTELMERGRDGAFPVDTYCIFEVLERCPSSRSGPDLEHCPACPIQTWCWSDRDEHPQGLPKAKRSRGHYKINDLIAMTAGMSKRVFESDFLCLRPTASDAWFTTFDESVHVTDDAEYRRNLGVHVAIDTGLYCGAVWFQVQRDMDGAPLLINVFGDYFAEDNKAGPDAVAIREQTRRLTWLDSMKRIRVSIEPNASHRSATGPSTLSEFEREGCIGFNGLEMWPYSNSAEGSKVDGLQFIETLLRAADEKVRLIIHSRCRNLIKAFSLYARARVNGVLVDRPRDPQDPHMSEDLIDPLAGGLKLEFPQGRVVLPNLAQVHAARIL